VPAAFSDPPKGRDAATDRQIAKMSVSRVHTPFLFHTHTNSHTDLLNTHHLIAYNSTSTLYAVRAARMLVVVVWMCKQ
jgi:hypothetical protein